MRFNQIQYMKGVVLFIVIAGCSSPATQYYMLSNDAGSVTELINPTPGPSIGIAPITLPEAVDRPQFVVRTGNNRITVVDLHRWVGSLKNEIPRVIAGNLLKILGPANILSYPQHGADTADIRIYVDIQQFESVLGKTATIDANVTVQWSDGKGYRTQRIHVEESVSGDSYDALAAAHSRALLGMSQSIASIIRTNVMGPSAPLR